MDAATRQWFADNVEGLAVLDGFLVELWPLDTLALR
jgi:hypothetical protein